METFKLVMSIAVPIYMMIGLSWMLYARHFYVCSKANNKQTISTCIGIAIIWPVMALGELILIHEDKEISFWRLIATIQIKPWFLIALVVCCYIINNNLKW